MRADPAQLLAPIYLAFPRAKPAIDVCQDAIRQAYPAVPTVTRVRIVDPTNGKEFATLTDGMTIRQEDLPAGATLVAEVSATPCTVQFAWDGVVVRVESNPPYCISGDRGAQALNSSDLLSPGYHEVIMTPFDRPNGEAGDPVRVRLTIVARPTDPGDGTGDGWTATPLAPGARQIFVRTDGDDGNAGDSPSQPVRSLGRALSLLRPTGGDRLCLFAGQTFEGNLGSWRRSGLPGMPAGVFAYGDSPTRPTIAVTQGSGITFDGEGLHDVALVGVRFTASSRDPASGSFDKKSPIRCGVEATRAVSGLLIEDCQFDHFPYNLNFIVWMSRARHTGVAVRRCLVLDAWALPEELYKGQGLYAESVADLLISQCVFDHNGWIENAPGVSRKMTQYRHGVYASAVKMGAVMFDGNLCSRNANCGTQQRSGGTVRGNLFIDNGVSALLSGDEAIFENNLVVDGHDTAEYGLGIAVSLSSRTGRAVGNVMVDAMNGYGPYPAARLNIDRREWTAGGPRQIEFADNTVVGCAGPAVRNGDRLASLSITGNDFLGVRQEIVALDRQADVLALRDNRYGPAARTALFSIGGSLIAFEEWTKQTSDSSVIIPARAAMTNWRPRADLIQFARSRPRGVWSSAYETAGMVSDARIAVGRGR